MLPHSTHFLLLNSYKLKLNQNSSKLEEEAQTINLVLHLKARNSLEC